MKFKKFNWFDKKETSAVKRVMRSGELSGFYGNWGEKFEGGREVKYFERECEEYFQTSHAVTFNSLASGLSAAIGAIGIGPGDEVILPPWTMSATAAAVLHWGGIPIFADIDVNTYCIDPEKIESLITEKTKALIAVDIFGQSANIEALKKITKRHNIYLISDSAQSVGAKRNGKYAGTLGDIGGISLNYHKHIHSGEGAVMFAENSEIALKLRMIRNHAETVISELPINLSLTNMVGHNYRLSELHAAIGREQLKKLEKIVVARELEVKMLVEKLQNLEGIVLPYVDDSNTHVYYMFAMQFIKSKFKVSKKVFIDEIKNLGVPGLSSSYINLHLLPVFQNKIAIGDKGFPWTYIDSRNDISYAKGICPVAENLQDETYFSFYINDYSLGKKQIKFIYDSFARVIDKFIRNNN